MSKSNIYRAIFFEKPDYIPMTFAINGACWHHYPQEWLVEQLVNHPFLFPNYAPPKLPYTPEYQLVGRKDEPYTDDFGCTWYTADDGITGTVLGHPLADWDAFDNYTFPDPEKCMGIGPVDWDAERERIQSARAKGDFVSASLRHGHTFLQLSDIRGYQNLLFDMADDEPRLWQLIEGVEAFNQAIVDHYLDIGVDMFGFPEDLGMQVGPMLSPDDFRTYIKPSYKRMMDSVRRKGLPIHMHSDGDIRMLVDDIVDSGVVYINLQDLVNGIDWIKERFRGKMCVDLDIDRQNVTVFGTPQQVDELIRTEVEALATPEGGLSMIYGLYPGTPMANVKALMDAMEKYAFYFS
ncbi:MAG: hypothetical protein IJJ23_06370 [Clostridia bacterium]|nr:hypothetical protein [Clostridia bacterium]